MKNLEIVNGVLVRCLDQDITDVTIPNSVKIIGNGAFEDCIGLTSITIPDSVKSIGSLAFSNCSSLTSITIPDSVTSIGDYAFLGCSSLTSVTIPDGVTSIGYSAFRGCSSLTNITIPKSVTSISNSAFSICSSLNQILVAEGNTVYHSAGNCLIKTSEKILITGCKSSIIPTDGSVTSIGSSAFSGCGSLTSITIPDSVTSIGSSAFSDCSNLMCITIPNSVTSIGDWAFYGCNGLKSQIRNYKAFNLRNGNLSCRCAVFSPMKWSDQIDNIEICQHGYHYCTNLFDVFNYYNGEIDKDIAIYECEVGDTTYSKESGDSKHVTNKIKPVKRLHRKNIARILSGQD